VDVINELSLFSAGFYTMRGVPREGIESGSDAIETYQKGSIQDSAAGRRVSNKAKTKPFSRGGTLMRCGFLSMVYRYRTSVRLRPDFVIFFVSAVARNPGERR
jgi:hypothetical protein